MDAIPLRIEWRLATPWSPNQQGLHLDGLIAWAIKEEFEHEGVAFTFESLLADLPFAKHVGQYGWVWQASLVQPQGRAGIERRYMTAKTASHQLAALSVAGQLEGRPLTNIDTVRGNFKNDAFWYTLEDVDHCIAWCVGDPERITPLLDRITHLARRGRLDHGRVESVEIHEDPEAETRWRERVMPDPIDGYVPTIGRLNPPYWTGEGQTALWRPPI